MPHVKYVDGLLDNVPQRDLTMDEAKEAAWLHFLGTNCYVVVQDETAVAPVEQPATTTTTDSATQPVSESHDETTTATETEVS